MQSVRDASRFRDNLDQNRNPLNSFLIGIKTHLLAFRFDKTKINFITYICHPPTPTSLWLAVVTAYFIWYYLSFVLCHIRFFQNISRIIICQRYWVVISVLLLKQFLHPPIVHFQGVRVSRALLCRLYLQLYSSVESQCNRIGFNDFCSPQCVINAGKSYYSGFAYIIIKNVEMYDFNCFCKILIPLTGLPSQSWLQGSVGGVYQQQTTKPLPVTVISTIRQQQLQWTLSLLLSTTQCRLPDRWGSEASQYGDITSGHWTLNISATQNIIFW